MADAEVLRVQLIMLWVLQNSTLSTLRNHVTELGMPVTETLPKHVDTLALDRCSQTILANPVEQAEELVQSEHPH